MTIRKQTDGRYGKIDQTFDLWDRNSAFIDRINSDTTISMTWVYNRLNVVRCYNFHCFSTRNRQKIRSFFYIPDFDLLIFRSANVFFLATGPSNRVDLVSMSWKRMKQFTALAMIHRNSSISRSCQKSLSAIVERNTKVYTFDRIGVYHSWGFKVVSIE